MKKTIHLVVISALAVVSLAATVNAQDTHIIEREGYTLELPTNWQPAVREPNAFVNGYAADGYLQIRVERNTTISIVADNQKEQKLQFLSGFVEGRTDTFSGILKGSVFNYEYSDAGKPWAGRIYYLQTQQGSVYVLQFRGLREKLRFVRSQVDSVARNFRPK